MFESPATLLYRLQIVDQAIVQRRTRIKQINTALEQSEAVQQAQTQVDVATQALKPWQARVRDLDLEMKGVASKIKATEDNLYSGRVVNPKALQELQNDIAALKRSQSKLEDSLLEAMMHSEEGQSKLDEANTALSAAQALHASSQVDLLVEKERLETELPKFIAQRKEAAATIEPAILATYDALRPKKGGNAVALLKQGSCAACQVEQTSNAVQKVQQGQALINCAACGRILAPRP